MVKKILKIIGISAVIGWLMGGCTGNCIKETVREMDVTIEVPADTVEVHSPSVQIRGTSGNEFLRSPENLRR